MSRGVLITSWIAVATGLFASAVLPGLDILLMFLIPGLAAGYVSSMGTVPAFLLVGTATATPFLLLVAAGFWGSATQLLVNAGFSIFLVIASWRRWSGPSTFLMGFAALCCLVFLLLASDGGGMVSSYNDLRDFFAREFEAARLRAENEGLGSGQDLTEWFRRLETLAFSFFPAGSGILFLVISLTNVLAARVAHGFRFKDTAPAPIFGPPFTEWRLPDGLVWGVIASGIAALFLPPPYSLAGKNSLLVLGAIYAIQGLSIVKYAFAQLNVPAAGRWVVYLLIGILWYGLLLLALVGIANVWFDLRGHILKRRGTPST